VTDGLSARCECDGYALPSRSCLGKLPGSAAEVNLVWADKLPLTWLPADHAVGLWMVPEAARKTFKSVNDKCENG
jgi:hypothetical protein